ncbi:MAG: hypothetical protein K2X03_06080 [Bryobacteraceae bacterium]|nr:hypothetical protein [Bryobacteraceae bacterium]
MNRPATLAFLLLSLVALLTAQTQPPRAGKVDIMPSAQLKPGMKAIAWTVFEGTVPEAVPIEIVGLWKNAWGPKQDIIIGKMGGKAQRTNVAGGMSGSPVYIDGKLVGAVALRLSVFSPDAICGITPIELMLEINDFDKTVPTDAKSPMKPVTRASVEMPNDLVRQVMAAADGALPQSLAMEPIGTPLVFSGFSEVTLREFGPLLRQQGINPVLGGAGSGSYNTKPVSGWANALQPGQSVAGVLVNGDMSVTGLGTVTYNDGKRVLAFGHPFFNMGPVDMPMSQGEILMVLASQFQPNKMGNATDIVGALKQDRHSGIMGVLGAESPMIPVNMKIRTQDEKGGVMKEKILRYNLFTHQKWTPFLSMMTVFNSISGINDFSDELTYRLTGQVEFDGQQKLRLDNTQTVMPESPAPAAMALTGYVGEKITKLFGNQVQMPKMKSMDITVDLIPERRILALESAWISLNEVSPGDEVTVKAYLRPFRGPRLERELKIRIPEGLPKGEHKIVLSDGESLNKLQSFFVTQNKFLDLPGALSLLNQERRNTQLFASLMQTKPTVYYDDKTLPSLPQSVLNVMQAGRTANRMISSYPETTVSQSSIELDQVITGSHTLKILVR